MKKTPLRRKSALKAKKGIRVAKSPKKRSELIVEPRRRKKKTDLQRAKDKLWKLCKEITLKRYGNDCYTCPSKDLQGSNCQLGHFISSSICSAEMRYELRNLRIQCYSCNIHKSGNWPVFEKNLKRDGIDVDYLKRHNEETKGEQYDTIWYTEQIERYQLLLDQA